MICIPLIELEIKDTTNTARSVKYPDLRFEMDSDEQLRKKLGDEGEYFNFRIM